MLVEDGESKDEREGDQHMARSLAYIHFLMLRFLRDY